MSVNDLDFMKIALEWAHKAALLGEVPVGAIIVSESGEILSHGYNHKEVWSSPLAHAEIIAIQRASQKLNSWRLTGCTMYVTLEPCSMCAGALVQARLKRVVYGAKDSKTGAIDSLYQLTRDQRLNHQLDVSSGVLEAECSEVLKDFFKKLRRERK